MEAKEDWQASSIACLALGVALTSLSRNVVLVADGGREGRAVGRRIP
jgi:hypothetical protein